MGFARLARLLPEAGAAREFIVLNQKYSCGTSKFEQPFPHRRVKPMWTGAVVRLAAGVALGAGMLAWVAAARRKRNPISQSNAPRIRPPERPSGHVPRPDGHLDADALVDEALMETFPASDPPARSAAVGMGGPPR
jgi:hypothetical protein